jgi:hypothetical protein
MIIGTTVTIPIIGIMPWVPYLYGSFMHPEIEQNIKKRIYERKIADIKKAYNIINDDPIEILKIRDIKMKKLDDYYKELNDKMKVNDKGGALLSAVRYGISDTLTTTSYIGYQPWYRKEKECYDKIFKN